MNKILCILLSFSLSFFALSGCSKQNDHDVKIGVLFPLTGDASSYGEKGKNAIELALVKIKEQDAKIQVKIIYEDSKADPKTGVTAMSKLVSIDRVPVVIGDIVSSVTLPAAAIAEKNRTVLLSPTSSAPAITHAGGYIFRIWPSDQAEGKAIAKHAFSLGKRNVAILHLNNDYGLAIADIFTSTFTELGGKVVLNEGYLDTDTDFRSMLTKVNYAKADAVYLAGYFSDSARIMKQAYEMKISTQFLGTTAIEDNNFLEIAGNAAEGIIYPLATGFDVQSATPLVKEFISTFEKKYGYKPGWVEAQSYDAMMLICSAIKAGKGQITGENIRRYLDSMGKYEGVTGAIKFDENGDVIKPIRFKTVKSGHFQNL